MYLTADKIGYHSRIMYGVKGTKVEVLKRGSDLWLVQANGIRFHVHRSGLALQVGNWQHYRRARNRSSQIIRLPNL